MSHEAGSWWLVATSKAFSYQLALRAIRKQSRHFGAAPNRRRARSSHGRHEWRVCRDFHSLRAAVALDAKLPFNSA